MIKNPPNVIAIESQEEKANNEAQNMLKKRITHLNALSCCFTMDKDFDVIGAENESEIALRALKAKGGLQEMLVTQMISIHQLQQTSMAMTNRTTDTNAKQYFTNAAIKLANTFIHQANLLSKLQGDIEQKIIVERVDVHHGGQAVVGNVSSSINTGEKK